MKLVVLVDNAPGKQDGLIAEHGLSIWMEVDGQQWLIDTGESDAFAQNASRLGINIADVDNLILSHGHRDHCGGLETFLSLNDKAKIYISANICDNNYYSTRRGMKRDISLTHSLIKSNAERIVFIKHNISLSDNVSIATTIPHNHPLPQANATLLKNDSLDDFDHEIVVAVNTLYGVVIISPCSHNGVLNTLDACSHLGNISHYIGGTHLIDNFENEEELNTLASILKIQHPNLALISGHCTGISAKNAFKNALNNKFIEFYTGFILETE